MKNKATIAAVSGFVALLLGSAAGSLSAATLAVRDLRCEYRVNPFGLDIVKPRLGWALVSNQRGQKQTAYHILVASTPQLLGRDQSDLWDSGKVASDQSFQVEYAGKSLLSQSRCHWKVRVWDKAGKASPWSAAGAWTMGLLKPEDWTAKWVTRDLKAETKPSSGKLVILKAVYATLDGAVSTNVTERVAGLVKDGNLAVQVRGETLGGDPAPGVVKQLRVEYEFDGQKGTEAASDFEVLELPGPDMPRPHPLDAPYLRRTFTLEAKPEAAMAFVNVMGWYELYINGTKVGDAVMSPAVTDYSKRSLYRTHDLQPYLRKGTNCLGLWLSRGWYWQGYRGVQHDTPLARVQVDMIVAGKPFGLGTDSAWRVKSSGRRILGSWSWGNFGGERVDARREDRRWADPDTDDSGWYSVAEVKALAIPAQAQRCPPDRILQAIRAVACTNLGPGKFELDFGVNLTGWLKLRLKGLQTGQRVRIRYSDRKDPYQFLGQVDEFISAGRPAEEFCSKFNYHGFRYAIMEWLPAAPALSEVQALLIGADWEPRGDFACSSALLNRMHQVNLWTLHCLSQGGFMSDCPHRERHGYGDGQVSVESCIMNFWMPNFYDKWSTDWRDVQDPGTGYIPHTAPQGGGGGGPAWGGSLQALTSRNYLYYADHRIVEQSYDACRRHIAAVEAHAQDGVVRAFGGEWGLIGDWVPPGRGMDTTNWPPKPAAELFNNCYRLYLREQWARMGDLLGRHDDARSCRTELERLRPLVHAAFYDPARQAYVLDEMSYYLLPLMTGVTPVELRPIMLKKLEDCLLKKNKGHLDTGMLGSYFLLNYLMEIGRNDMIFTLVNQPTYPGWGYMLQQGATTWWEQWNGFMSHIHSCFTSLDGWFYQGLAGIRPDPATPDFKKIIIKPAVVGDLTWVKAHHDSPYGRIVSNWTREGNTLTMNVTIPANATATVHVPATEASTVKESGQPAVQAEGVEFERMEDGAAVFHIGSGNYGFQSTLPEAIPQTPKAGAS
ncbi:MAG: family 78 glycoside hydrolase catalytic domain [Verrucomicrobia bacterium]|nr:family 78 glycoside hydrolase catalytic domain [Verrucomicrobiota bacterium]